MIKNVAAEIFQIFPANGLPVPAADAAFLVDAPPAHRTKADARPGEGDANIQSPATSDPTPAHPTDKSDAGPLGRIANYPTETGSQRGRIVLAAAAGKSHQQIAGELKLPEVTVSKWRRGFASKGLDGLRDAPRSGRPVKYSQEILQPVQNRVCQPPEHSSRWTVRTLAEDLKLPIDTICLGSSTGYKTPCQIKKEWATRITQRSTR